MVYVSEANSLLHTQTECQRLHKDHTAHQQAQNSVLHVRQVQRPIHKLEHFCFELAEDAIANYVLDEGVLVLAVVELESLFDVDSEGLQEKREEGYGKHELGVTR